MWEEVSTRVRTSCSRQIVHEYEPPEVTVKGEPARSEAALSPERSIWRQHFDGGLVERVLRRAYLDAYLPVASHEQIATRAEMAFPIRL